LAVDGTAAKHSAATDIEASLKTERIWIFPVEPITKASGTLTKNGPTIQF
jgi:hypothetical protein